MLQGDIPFIASEGMNFVAWFQALLDASPFPGGALHAASESLSGGPWPSTRGIAPPDPWPLPLLNTLILLASGATVTAAHHALLANDRRGLKYGLILTILLGAAFVGMQTWHYSQAARPFAGNIYGAVLFMATGFHGFQVLAGIVALIVCLLCVYAGYFSPARRLGFELAAWYWHCADVAWLFLFAGIHVWSVA